MVCTACDMFRCVCDKCIQESHIRHELCTFETAANTLIMRLEETATKEVFSQAEEDFRNFIETRRTETEHAEKTKQDIMNTREDIKRFADEVANILLQDHKMKSDALFKHFDEVERQLKTRMRRVQTFKSDIARLKHIKDSLSVITQGRQIMIPFVARQRRPIVTRLSFVPNFLSAEIL